MPNISGYGGNQYNYNNFGSSAASGASGSSGTVSSSAASGASSASSSATPSSTNVVTYKAKAPAHTSNIDDWEQKLNEWFGDKVNVDDGTSGASGASGVNGASGASGASGANDPSGSNSSDDLYNNEINDFYDWLSKNNYFGDYDFDDLYDKYIKSLLNGGSDDDFLADNTGSGNSNTGTTGTQGTDTSDISNESTHSGDNNGINTKGGNNTPGKNSSWHDFYKGAIHEQYGYGNVIESERGDKAYLNDSASGPGSAISHTMGALVIGTFRYLTR